MTKSQKLCGLGLGLMLLLSVVSMTVGVADFSWGEVFTNPHALELLVVSRFPRTLAVILTGATLSVAGMVLQIVLKNKFIEPSMVGATQSAALGVLLVTLIVPELSLFWKMGAASAAALVGMGIFLVLLRHLPKEDRLMVPLTGIIFGSIIDAVSNFIALETDSMQMLGVWFTGDFSGILQGRYEWLWLTAFFAVLIYALADRLTIAGLGKGLTTSLGVNYERMLWFALVCTAFITALVVVTVGQIPFVGLVVPNVVSRLMGDRLRSNLPVVALMGANLLLVCDLAGRTLDAPYEIPVSTVFGVLGAAVFLYLLLGKERRYD